MVRRKRNARKKKGSSAALTLAAVLLLLFLCAGGAAGWLLWEPFGPGGETFVDIAPGSSSIAIARQLETAGIIRNRYLFDLVRLRKRGVLRAGFYRFDHPAPVTEVYARILRGDVYTRAVTIPEGSNIFEIAARLQQAGLGTKEKFLAAAVGEASLVADFDPAAKNLEGYLFPDTYQFSPRATAGQMAAAMVRRFRAVAAQIGLKGNVHSVVTLASLVERETAVDAERPLVAGVFENRLAAKMPLMTDPSLIYGLEVEGLWRGTIYKSDLARTTPYNTYLHAGLPPGPIANPGAKSLRAALNPAKSDFLYFVAAGANPQGHSVFSRTLDEQNHNVAGYRSAVKHAGGR